MSRPSKYGVNTFISEVHVDIVEFEEAFKTPEYQFFVEYKDIHSFNGNGRGEFRIYTNGELKVFEVGDWKISPIVKAPFNWTGYSIELEIQDINMNTLIIKETPESETLFSKKNFVKDIQRAFEIMNLLNNIENVQHWDLYCHIKKNIRILSIYKEKELSISSIKEYVDKIYYEIDELKKLELDDVNNLLMTKEINKAIDLYNSLSIKNI